MLQSVSMRMNHAFLYTSQYFSASIIYWDADRHRKNRRKKTDTTRIMGDYVVNTFASGQKKSAKYPRVLKNIFTLS